MFELRTCPNGCNFFLLIPTRIAYSFLALHNEIKAVSLHCYSSKTDPHNGRATEMLLQVDLLYASRNCLQEVANERTGFERKRRSKVVCALPQ